MVAFAMEDCLDYFFMGVADIRPMSLPQLAELWQRDDTVDKAEHCAIAAVPGREEILSRCLAEERLPAEVWRRLTSDNLVAFGPSLTNLPEEAQRWQPSSHIRLAAGWWYIDQFIRTKPI